MLRVACLAPCLVAALLGARSALAQAQRYELDALDRWKKLAEPYRSAAREAIARVAAKAELSKDVREVVSRALAD